MQQTWSLNTEVLSQAGFKVCLIHDGAVWGQWQLCSASKTTSTSMLAHTWTAMFTNFPLGSITVRVSSLQMSVNVTLWTIATCWSQWHHPFCLSVFILLRWKQPSHSPNSDQLKRGSSSQHRRKPAETLRIVRLENSVWLCIRSRVNVRHKKKLSLFYHCHAILRLSVRSTLLQWSAHYS